jgi:hypothetical protein
VKTMLLLFILAALILAPITILCALVPDGYVPPSGVQLRPFYASVASVVTKQDCLNTIGKPAARLEYIGSPHNEVVGNVWVYRVRDGVRQLDARVWWNLETGEKNQVTYHDPVSGEVLR